MKKLALIGSQDFANQIRIFAERTGQFKIVGCFDDFEAKRSIVNNMIVLGKLSDIEDSYNSKLFDCLFCAIGYNNFNFREETFNRYKGKVPFANIIMPTAMVDPTSIIGEGVFIGEKSYIDAEVVIEDNVFLRLDVVIGHNSLIQSHSYFSGLNCVAGHCHLGKRLFIGTGTIIGDNITVADDIWIGMGCNVAQNLFKIAKYMSSAIRLIPAPR